MSRGGASREGKDAPRTHVDLVLALMLDPAVRARTASALKPYHRIRFFDRIGELQRFIATSPDEVAAIVVEMRDADGRSTRQAVAQMRAAGVRIPLLAYCRAGAEHSSEIRALVLAGVHDLLFEGIDDDGMALRAVFGQARRAQIGERAFAALATLLPRRLWPFARHVTSYPATQRVSEVASALGVHRKTLVNHSAQEGLPPPRELLAWCRLVVVGELLATTPRTLESIALELDFASDTALRNMIKRYTGVRATDIRTGGGLSCVLRIMRRAIQEHRGSTRNYSAPPEMGASRVEHSRLAPS